MTAEMARVFELREGWSPATTREPVAS
jgi:hypothetical protein